MDVSRSAVLNAHVIGTLLRSLVAIAIVTGVAFLMGFGPSAGSAVTAIAWCVGLASIGYLWARASFTKRA